MELIKFCCSGYTQLDVEGGTSSRPVTPVAGGGRSPRQSLTPGSMHGRVFLVPCDLSSVRVYHVH